MEYRILGKTGLRISRVGFGGIPIQRIDAEGTKELIRYLHDAGVNYIDTARSYTVSEEYLGYALEGIRQDFVLATKSPALTKDKVSALRIFPKHPYSTCYTSYISFLISIIKPAVFTKYPIS